MELFERDDEKAAINETKHGVTFTEAETVFDDGLSSIFPDRYHSGDEERFVIVGESNRRRLLTVVYTLREPRIRLISAREATPRERHDYEESED